MTADLSCSDSPRAHRSSVTSGRLCLCLVALTLLVSGSALATTARAGAPGPGKASKAPKRLQLKVISNRADLVSGGDALVEVVLPKGATLRGLRVRAGARDVSDAFARRKQHGGRILGLVERLKVGRNRLSARVRDGRGARLTITNHPVGGPIFSGPHQQPWACTTVLNGLGPALDDDCNAAPRYDFFYMSTTARRFLPFDPTRPASDVATVTTDQGVTRRYIVRRERGSVDRGVYEVAVLFDPSKPWAPFAPQQGWNHKLFVPTAGGFFHFYNQGVLVATNEPCGDCVLNDMALRRGFMTARPIFWQPATHWDPVRAAESLMMLKERISEQYGSIRYTFAFGASGGSITQSQVANLYPGLLQGIIPQAEFVDYWSTTDQETLDCHLLFRYFHTTSPNLWLDPNARIAVFGHSNEVSCAEFEAVFTNTSNKPETTPAGLAPTTLYHPSANPRGARSNVADYQVNYLGRRDPSRWTPQEQAAGFGFAPAVRDNVGVQYGLGALAARKVTAEQFVDLNEKVGGVDIDFNRVPQRTEQDPGVARVMYRTGFVSDAGNLDNVAIIGLRRQDIDPVATHKVTDSYIYMDRLRRRHGHANNHVWWLIPDMAQDAPHPLSFVAMDRWLAAIEADTSRRPLAKKIIMNKPRDLVDGCWAPGSTNIELTNQELDMNRCKTWFPVSQNPRIASTPDANRGVTFVTKCQLRALTRSDYSVEFTDEQWSRLQRAFPAGVCDWSKPDAALNDGPRSIPWLTYENGPGGTPIEKAPKSTPFGRRRTR